MQKKFNLKDLSYKEIELAVPKWLIESKDGEQVLLDCGRDKKLKDLVLKEVERLGLKSIEWHYNPGLIIVVF
jgi:hypothetical protein